MQLLTGARIIAGSVALTGFAAARAAHQTSAAAGDAPPPEGRSIARSALVGLAAAPLGLAYMFPFTSAEGGGRQRAIITAVGGLQFAATAAIANYMNHNGDGQNSTLGTMALSSATGAAFGALGGALVSHGSPKVMGTMAALGAIGGFPDGGWIQLFNRPGHDGFADFGSWLRGDVPR